MAKSTVVRNYVEFVVEISEKGEAVYEGGRPETLSATRFPGSEGAEAAREGRLLDLSYSTVHYGEVLAIGLPSAYRFETLIDGDAHNLGTYRVYRVSLDRAENCLLFEARGPGLRDCPNCTGRGTSENSPTCDHSGK